MPIAAAYAARRSRKHLAWAFVALTIGYVAVVGNATEVGENNRFRLATDALSVTALAAAGQAAARGLAEYTRPIGGCAEAPQRGGFEHRSALRKPRRFRR